VIKINDMTKVTDKMDFRIVFPILILDFIFRDCVPVISLNKWSSVTTDLP